MAKMNLLIRFICQFRLVSITANVLVHT